MSKPRGNAPRTGKATLPDILTYDERQRFLSAIDTFEDLLFCRIGLYSGLRLSEILMLQKGDISNVIRVREGKGGKDRIVPLDYATKQIIQCFITQRALADGDPLFTISNRTAQRHVDDIAQKAKIQHFKVTPHTLRHTCATWLVDRGMDLRRVQMILGHEDIGTTQIYLHLSPNAVVKSYEQIIGEGV